VDELRTTLCAAWPRLLHLRYRRLAGEDRRGPPTYRLPKGPTGLWQITGWETEGGTSAQWTRGRLRVYRRTPTRGQLELVKESVPFGEASFFKTRLHVRRGDLLRIFTAGFVPSTYPTGLTCKPVRQSDPLSRCDLTVGQLVGPEPRARLRAPPTCSSMSSRC